MYTQQYRMYYNQPQYRYKNRFDMGFMSGLLNSVPLPVIIGSVLAVVVIGVIVSSSGNKKPFSEIYVNSIGNAGGDNSNLGKKIGWFSGNQTTYKTPEEARKAVLKAQPDAVAFSYLKSSGHIQVWIKDYPHKNRQPNNGWDTYVLNK